MKRVLSVLTLLCLLATVAFAQQYKKAFSGSGAKRVQIVIENSELSIEGSSGNEVVINTSDGDFEMPERAKGLRPLYRDASDNTGIGLEVTESGNTITIKKASGKEGDYRIQIPADASIKIEEVGWQSDDFSISGVKGEIEIQSTGSDIELKDITGPIVANTTSGDITVVFSQLSQEGPTSISNTSGFIDVTMPANAKANLELSSISGDIYTDMDLKSNDGMKQVGGSSIKAAINGGGVEVSLRTISDDIYLRKK